MKSHGQSFPCVADGRGIGRLEKGRSSYIKRGGLASPIFRPIRENAGPEPILRAPAFAMPKPEGSSMEPLASMRPERLQAMPMATRVGKKRADQLVQEQGLAESREKAKRLIMAGEVLLMPHEGSKALPVRVDKPGQTYPADSVFSLAGQDRYVSRGAYKLLTILESASMDVTGYVCLDAGASTGGFTDVLLQRGAARVYAVDVGKNQLHEKLKNDERVVNLEGVNLRNAACDLIPEPVDLVVADVSFISLTLVLPPCMRWLKVGGHVAALIKPQFELGPGQTDKGVVRSEEARMRAVEKVVTFARDSLGLRDLSVVPAAIKGPKGNQEYLALFRKEENAPLPQQVQEERQARQGLSVGTASVPDGRPEENGVFS